MEWMNQFRLLIYIQLICLITEDECLSISAPYHIAISPARPIKIKEGENLQLKCVIEHVENSLPSIVKHFSPTEPPSWEYPKHFTGRTQIVEKVQDVYSSALLLENAQAEDSGLYTCSSTIQLWHLHETVNVTIERKYSLKDLELSIEPNKMIQISVGDSLRVNCTINRYQQHEKNKLTWESSKKTVKQVHVPPSTVTMVIVKASEADAGVYKCVLYRHVQPPIWKVLEVFVNTNSSKGSLCSKTKFMCETSKHCIFLRYRCNGEVDCKDGSDEKNCGDDMCDMKYRCKNGRCIEPELVCDKLHSNDCGDWSDEDCQEPEGIYLVNRTIVNVDKDSEEDQMHWLKTTVYAVIGCTVSIVIFISIVAIAVFRIRMKKDALRHAELALERRQRSETSRDTTVGLPAEQQPFIGGGSGGAGRSNYGNLFVNVSNSVQLVPRQNFRIVEAPPSYSEVEEEIHAIENVPPPDYSTIDRNPLRPNSLQLMGASNSENNNNNNNNNNNDNNNNNNNNSRARGGSRSRPQVQHVSVQTQSRGSSGHRGANRSEARSKRPNMDVQGGQIILTDQQLATVPGSTQTVNTNSNRPARIQVHGGQIVFSSGSSHTENTSLPLMTSPAVQTTVSSNNTSSIVTSHPALTYASITDDAVTMETPISTPSLSEQATLQCRPNSVPTDSSVLSGYDYNCSVGDSELSENISSTDRDTSPMYLSSTHVQSCAVLPASDPGDEVDIDSSSVVEDSDDRENSTSQEGTPETRVDNPGGVQLHVMDGRIYLSNNQNTFPRMSTSQRSNGSQRSASPDQGRIGVRDGNIVIS